MKKALVLVAALLTVGVAVARPVDIKKATQMAEKYFGQVVDITPDAWSELYVFEPLEGKGFIVISADDCTRPVLAISEASSFNPNDIPPHVDQWFAGYRAEIASLRAAGAVPSPQVQQEWQNGLSTTLPSGVSPLMTTTWNQNPRYNWECPYSEEDQAYTVTGCVATAAAQVMKYWNHPAKGHGSHGYSHKDWGYLSVKFDTLYQWDDMPDALTWSSTDKEIHAVAQLMHHVGVAVEMNYGVKESGAYMQAYGSYNLPSTERALKEHFRYNPMLKNINKDEIESDAIWDSILRHEIAYGRPVLYAGSDNDGGHAFVIDGYNAEGFFHVNWGWGGWYDGFYTTDSLSPGAGGTGGNSTYTFNKNNAALIYVFPSYGNDTVAVINAVSADSTMGVVEGNGSFDAYHDTVKVLAVAKDGYRFDGWTNGLVTNPFIFVPNGDFADTALFVPLNKDTLGYSDECYLTGWQDEYSSITEWGIRIPAALRNSVRSLSAVQLYVQVEGYYTMSVYYGDSIDIDNRVYYDQVDLTEACGWTEIVLPEAIPLVGDKPLWITFRFSSSDSYPASMSFYTGVPDGTWYKTYTGWIRMSDVGNYCTWMIRAVFSERNYVVDLQADGYVGLENVSGGGEYAPGESCTISTVYGGNPPFVYWDFGHGVVISEDPYTFAVTQDTVIKAVGTCIGIDDVENEMLRVAVDGLTITLQGKSSEEATLYSIDGRKMGTGHRFTVPCAGVYMLRTSSGFSAKVVVL